MVNANLSELEAAEQRKREVVDMINDVLEHYVLKQQVPENRFFEFKSLSKGKYFLTDLKERDGAELSKISVGSFLELMSETEKNKIRNTCPIVLTQDMDLTGRTIIAKNLFIYDPEFSLKADRIIADNIILYGGSLKANSVTALFGAMFANSFVVADEFIVSELLTFNSSFIANKFKYGTSKRLNSFQYANNSGNITSLYDNIDSKYGYGSYSSFDLKEEVKKLVKSYKNSNNEYNFFIFDTIDVDALLQRLDVVYKQLAACSISSLLMSGASDSMTPPAMEVAFMETGATASSSTIDEIF